MPPRCSRYDPEIGQQLVAGLTQQNPEWIGSNLDGCLAHPGTPDDHRHRVATWRTVAATLPTAASSAWTWRTTLTNRCNAGVSVSAAAARRWRPSSASCVRGLASSINVGAFNLGNAVGAALGGAVISLDLDYAAVPMAGGVLAATGLLLVWLGGRSKAAGKTAADAA